MKKVKNILITGGTGMLGKALQKQLQGENYELAVLTRRSEVQGIRSFRWDDENAYLDPEAVEFADVIVHLAGENISSGRWTHHQKLAILESRVNSGDLLYRSISQSKNPPSLIISASAIGYYGSVTSDQVFVESDAPGKDFLAKTVIAWEKSLDPIAKIGVDVKKIRIGIVLSADGGALLKMMQPVKNGLGSPLGTGKQWMPWVSQKDLVRIIEYLIQNKVKGDVFNAVAPDHISNHDFMKTLSSVLGKPFFMPNVPRFVLRTILGEMSTIVLEGSRVSSEKLQQEGFQFLDIDLQETLQKILK